MKGSWREFVYNSTKTSSNALKQAYTPAVLTCRFNRSHKLYFSVVHSTCVTTDLFVGMYTHCQ